MRLGRIGAAALFCLALALGQKPEYDFYHDFRNTFIPQQRAAKPAVTDDELLERYIAKLQSDGVDSGEIARRLRLIRTERELLESDYWNRFYTNGKSNFNRAPNGFLVRMVEGRPPGTALDYGMGEGRNSLYLAKLGWQVWGFDPADVRRAVCEPNLVVIELKHCRRDKLAINKSL
jgi:Tellurite resistance protein TehB